LLDPTPHLRVTIADCTLVIMHFKKRHRTPLICDAYCAAQQ
jgi:hypothetical protein